MNSIVLPPSIDTDLKRLESAQRKFGVFSLDQPNRPWVKEYDVDGDVLALVTPKPASLTTQPDGWLIGYQFEGGNDKFNDTAEVVDLSKGAEAVKRCLGNLALSAEDSIDIWTIFVETIISSSDKQHFAYTARHGLLRALGHRADTILEGAEVQPRQKKRATPKIPASSYEIHERINSGATYEGVFQRIKNTVNPYTYDQNWERHYKNPENGKHEVHRINGRYSWLLEEDNMFEYHLAYPQSVTAEEAVVLVKPTREDIEYAEELYEEIKYCKDQVVEGELLFGRFIVPTYKDTGSDAKEVRMATFSVVIDGKKFIYSMDDMYLDDFSTAKIHTSGKSGQCCFFRINGTTLNKKGDTHVNCSMVGPKPKETPDYFLSKTSNSDCYVSSRLYREAGIQAYGNRGHASSLYCADSALPAPKN